MFFTGIGAIEDVQQEKYSLSVRIGRFSNALKRVAIAVHDDPDGAFRKLAASGEAGAGELKEFAKMFLRRP